MKEITRKNKVFWSWNGEMKEPEIRLQICDFAKRGIGGFFIHARAGLKLSYMSEEWFSAIAVAIDEAKKQNLEVWLYDENGWPSGFSGGAVLNHGTWALQKEVAFCEEEKDVCGEFIAKYEKVRGGYQITEKDNADLYCFAKVNANYVDLLNDKVVDLFIESTHERYKERFGAYFGTVIRGIFTDEPQLAFRTAWSPRLEERYNAVYGNLRADLWLLREDTAKGRKFRSHFYELYAKLFAESFTDKLNRWCRENNLLLTGHFGGEDGISTQYQLSGNVANHYRYMDYPGIDFLGRRLTSPVLLKQIGSVKRQVGYKNVLSETFGCCGWNTSFSQYAWIWGYQAAYGVNTACLHLSAYTISGIRKRDYPAFFSYQSPWWNYADVLFQWMENVNGAVSQGKPFADVAILSPITACFKGVAGCSQNGRISTFYRQLIENLEDAQIPFDVLDEWMLEEKGKVKDGALNVGRMNYRYLILPDGAEPSQNALRKIKKFAQGGGIVLVGNEQSLTGTQGKALSSVLKESGRFYEYFNSAKKLEKIFEYYGYRRPVALYGKDEILVKSCKIHVSEDADRLYVFICNTSVCDEKRFVLTFNRRGSVYRVNLSSGKKYLQEAVASPCRTYTEQTLKPMESAYFILDKKNDTNRIRRKVEKKLLHSEQFRVCDQNAITLDYADCIVDGEKVFENAPVQRIQEYLYGKSAEITKDIAVEVLFGVQCDEVPETAELFLERGHFSDVSVNGALVTLNDDRWWIDKSIIGSDIKNLLVKGWNKISVVGTLKAAKTLIDVENSFECVRNVFSYPLEIENCYVRGKFGVKSAPIQNHSGYYKTAGNFAITRERPLTTDCDITDCGYPFYRGEIVAEYEAELTKDCNYYVESERSHAVLLRIFVNGVFCGSIGDGAASLEITDFVKEGRNKITVVAVSGNRNLLGPHHHIRGEQNFVGLSTFVGKRGYEDNVVRTDAPECTYVDDYHFVPFAIGDVYLTKERIEKEEF